MWLYAEIKTLGDIPRHYGRTTPDRLALLDSLGRTSFAELDVRSNRMGKSPGVVGFGGRGVITADLLGVSLPVFGGGPSRSGQ